MPTIRVWHPTYQALLEAARQGDHAAAIALFDAWAHHFLRVIRRRLQQPLRRLVDSFDILQDVRLELCADDLPPSAFESQLTYFKYLVGMVKHQLDEARRHHLSTAKRDLRRDVPLDKSGVEATVPAPRESGESFAREEKWQQLLNAQPLVYRAILVQWRRGLRQEAIAELLNVSDRTVRRVLAKISRPPESSTSIRACLQMTHRPAVFRLDADLHQVRRKFTVAA